MNEYIKNILNQPDKIEVGQVWSNVDSKRRYLITDVIDEDTGTYRAVILTGVLALNDGSDVVIKKDRNKFLAKDKLALRITDGPIHKKQLDFCIGKIDNSTIEKIKESLKIREFNYDDDQDFVISEILDELHDEHLEAVNYYEAALEEVEKVSRVALVVDISSLQETNVAQNVEEETVAYFRSAISKLAADDISNKEAELHFWQEIKEMPSENIYKTDNTEIYLSFDFKRNKMLLVAYATEDINIEGIKLNMGNEIINAEKVYTGVDANTEILTIVYVFDVNLNSLKSKDGLLTFSLNNNKLQKEIMFK